MTSMPVLIVDTPNGTVHGDEDDRDGVVSDGDEVDEELIVAADSRQSDDDDYDE